MCRTHRAGGLSKSQSSDRDHHCGSERQPASDHRLGVNLLAVVEWRDDHKGVGSAVQRNLVGRQVLDAMVKAFEGTEGQLAERLFAALEAGDWTGGDRRRRQSAASW